MPSFKIKDPHPVWPPFGLGAGALPLLLAGCALLLLTGLGGLWARGGSGGRLVCYVQPGTLALSGSQGGMGCNCSAHQQQELVLPPQNSSSAQQQERPPLHSEPQLQQQQQLDEGVQLQPEQLVCGDPTSVPSVMDSLTASTEAMLQGPEEDLKPYEGGFTLEDIKATASALGVDGEAWDVRAWVEVRNKRIVFPHRQDMICPKPTQGCNHMMDLIVESLERGMATGKLSLPENIPMLWNVQDDSQCSNPQDGNRGICRAPVFSLFKLGSDLDIMVPPMRPQFKAIFVPWEEKIDLAFFRGAPICSFIPLLQPADPSGGFPNCSRWRVAELSWARPDLLNATLTHNVTQYGGPPFVPGRHATDEEHAQHKWLLNVDGSTAAHRLTTLLAFNSLVVKQASPMIAWYYRAIKPCVHYVHYWVTREDDLFELIPKLRLPANQAMAQRVAANGQAFAMHHFTEEAMWKYWERLLQRYVELYRGGSGGAREGQPASENNKSSSSNNSNNAAAGNAAGAAAL